jgi:hypothetical protein
VEIGGNLTDRLREKSTATTSSTSLVGFAVGCHCRIKNSLSDDDECCESVESTTTTAASVDCNDELLCILCVRVGKSMEAQSVAATSSGFVQWLEQVFRNFFN